MKRSVLALLLLCTPLLSFAQSVWQGSCAVGTYGTFPATGYYGASNSFAQNTLVRVENPNTRKTATVLIIDRLKDNGLFLLLSKEAGAAIGLSSGEVAQVTVTLSEQNLSAFRGPGDLPYSPDSDIYPAAGAGNPLSLSFLDKYLKAAGAPPQVAAAQPAAGPVAQAGAKPASGVEGTSPAQPPAAQPPAAAPPAAAPPAAAPPAAAQPSPPETAARAGAGPLVSALEQQQAPAPAAPPPLVTAAPVAPATAGAAPVVSGLLPLAAPSPAEVLAFTGAPVLPEIRNPGPLWNALAAATPPPAGLLPSFVAQAPVIASRSAALPLVADLAQAVPPAAPFMISLSALPLLPAEVAAVGGPLVSALAAASPPVAAEELIAAGPATPGLAGLTPEVNRLVTAPPPAAAQPEASTGLVAPEIAQALGVAKEVPAPAAAVVPSPAAIQPAAVRPSSALVAGSFYVQLGAYFESRAALALVGNLSPDYPVSVYAFAQGKKPLYKVLIGPLNSAESGTLLYLFIDQGYRGAFIRKAE